MTACRQCGYDAAVWRPNDERSFLGVAELWWELATADADAGALAGVAEARHTLDAERDAGDVHGVIHRHMEIGVALAAAAASTPPHTGEVVQVNASGGGVPKLPVDGADVTYAGLAGDRQADRKHHGRPFQALSLWSSEVIAELAAAGHPIAAGCAGENVTVSGVHWARVRPGARIRIGTALAEVSFPATPCAKQSRWFTDGDFRRIDHGNNPQWTRWYAWVREPGHVRPGDAVQVQP